jgi:hypothetical protein
MNRFNRRNAMTRTLTVWSVAALLALFASAGHAREREAVGTSSDPLKIGPAPSSKPQPRDACKQGYVWREARQGDHVCVHPRTRDEVAQQNRQAPKLWVNGDYGPRTCRQGYVWREAYNGDQVCVRPEVRERTREDNSKAAQRRVRG